MSLALQFFQSRQKSERFHVDADERIAAQFQNYDPRYLLKHASLNTRHVVVVEIPKCKNKSFS